MTLREINQKISEKRVENNNYRKLYWETQREVESLQSEKRKLELNALFEYLPIGSEYIVSGYKSVAGINYRGGDKVEIFKKNPRSVVLKWIQMFNPKATSSTTSKKDNITYHRIDIDKFFDMLMSDSSEFARGFKTYLTRKSTLEELGL